MEADLSVSMAVILSIVLSCECDNYFYLYFWQSNSCYFQPLLFSIYSISSFFFHFFLLNFILNESQNFSSCFFISQVFCFSFFKMFNWGNLIVVAIILKWDSSSYWSSSIFICFLGTVVFIRNDIFPFLGLKITTYSL